jgi:hypothetical protein
MNLDKLIESAAECLPDGWSIMLEVEKGAMSINAIRPDQTKIPLDDCDRDISELFGDAIRVAFDEVEADRIRAESEG